MLHVRLVPIAALALLAGCGSQAGSGAASATTSTGPPRTVSPSSAQPTPPAQSASPTPSGPGRTLTSADIGATVTLRTGDYLTVDLAPTAGVYAWDRPRLTGSALRLVSVTGGYPARRPVLAVFLAAAPGTVTLSASSDLPCLHSRPACLPAQREWMVRVIIQSTR
jgi:hypothetical protein